MLSLIARELVPAFHKVIVAFFTEICKWAEYYICILCPVPICWGTQVSETFVLYCHPQKNFDTGWKKNTSLTLYLPLYWENVTIITIYCFLQLSSFFTCCLRLSFCSYPDCFILGISFQGCIQNPLNWMLAEPVWNVTFGHWALCCVLSRPLCTVSHGVLSRAMTQPLVCHCLSEISFISRPWGLSIRSYLFY